VEVRSPDSLEPDLTPISATQTWALEGRQFEIVRSSLGARLLSPVTAGVKKGRARYPRRGSSPEWTGRRRTRHGCRVARYGRPPNHRGWTRATSGPAPGPAGLKRHRGPGGGREAHRSLRCRPNRWNRSRAPVHRAEHLFFRSVGQIESNLRD